MNSKEFSKKVKPFRKILSEDSFDDLLDYFLDSDNEKSEPSTSKEINETNIDSKIITLQKAELISKWIDKSDELTTSYKFNYIVDLMKHLPDLMYLKNSMKNVIINLVL
ncbi:hypothetical protein RirG_001900 [Rhizophagus irregularis DAOM 197198w]|uniref:Uncharacterized protein n=1 Tax=Rhizophagus irregularis (strain DAOM 197198w) TaxID=1432141 RepID=A0A015NK52_RHIIW|nr:hypothetical protein RirG_001900 [Rhizophagus irregularis DAOM 197198w]